MRYFSVTHHDGTAAEYWAIWARDTAHAERQAKRSGARLTTATTEALGRDGETEPYGLRFCRRVFAVWEAAEPRGA